MATGSACTACWTAIPRRAWSKAADAAEKRWSKPCAVIGQPRVAAIVARAAQEAAGSAHQVKTSVRTKREPVSLETRWTKPVSAAKRSALVVSKRFIRRESCGIVVAIGHSFG